MDKPYHDVIGGVVIADILYDPRILLLQRDQSKKYWPGKWCYLTEHRKEDETDIQALERGLREETGLTSVLITKGPIIIERFPPEYQEKFVVRLYQCIPNDRNVDLNEENSHYVWHSLSIPLEQNPLIKSRDNLIEFVHEDLATLGLDVYSL